MRPSHIFSLGLYLFFKSKTRITLSLADRTIPVLVSTIHKTVRPQWFNSYDSWLAGNAAEIICRTALCISGNSLRQSLTSFRSSSVSFFSCKSLLKNSATIIPNAWQHRSIVETVGLFPRFIMLEIVDCEIFASFASWYFDHPRSSRSSVIRLSNSYLSPPHHTLILYEKCALALERIGLIIILCYCVVSHIECGVIGVP